jgi:hypothetical protein
MVSTTNKAPTMTNQNTLAEGLSEVRELNRLFLVFLRKRLAETDANWGLPAPAAKALAQATDDSVRRLAAYPQALFCFDFSQLRARGVHEATGTPIDPSLRALQSMLLVSARHISRQHPYAARLHLRLSAEQARVLTALPITDLPAIARNQQIVLCAYRKLAWMWTKLLQCPEP